MKQPIGFTVCDTPEKRVHAAPKQPQNTPIKSLVEVNFPFQDTIYTYYNDRFDLKQGDIVFVEGSMEGKYGIVCKVTKKFKIKPADYKKIISVADVAVFGPMHFLEDHIVSFDPAVLPYEKVRTWFIGREEEDDYEISRDDQGFTLDNLEQMDVTKKVFDRGWDYYMSDYVMYLSLHGTQGSAIVKRDKAYEVEFEYHNGEIRNLFCNCPCGETCKHCVAAVLQLKDLLGKINHHYPDCHQGYFAAVPKDVFFDFLVRNRPNGTFIFK